MTAMQDSRRRSALGLTELIVSLFVVSLILAAVISLTGSVLRVTDRSSTDNSMNDNARLAMDEMLLQIRCSSKILPLLPGTVLSGNTYTTSNSSLVLTAPGYNPASSAVFLGVTDYVTYRFNAANKTLTETIRPGAGSVRPSRIDTVLARNVSSVAYTFKARDQFKVIVAGTRTLTLKATPLQKPVAFINGVAATCSWGGGATVSVTTAQNGSDVQLIYPVSPAAAVTAASEVEAVLTFTALNGRRQTQTQTIQGAACLRNSRL